MEFRILGPLEVVDDGRVLGLGSGRQLALVALLLLNANETVSMDRLVDELWGESPPPTAAKIVRNSISLLRRELGDRLVTRPPGYLLRVEEDELDSRHLERAVEGGHLDELTDALALWRGSPLSQFAYEQFAQNEIARLEELRLTAVEARVEAQLAVGRHASAIAELEALIQQHPLRERLCGQLMLALYRSGRQAEALDVYQRTRRSLDDQLGISPEPSLRELERKILNQDESLGASAAAVPAELTGRRRPLALVVAAFVLAAAAAAAFALTRDAAPGLGEIPPNYVGMIDPKTNAIVAAIPVGIRPGPVAAGTGSIWVGNLEDRNLTRIDPRRRAVTAVRGLGNRTPTGLAVGAGWVWVAHGARGELSRVEPQFGEVLTIAVTRPPYGTPFGSVAGSAAGSVWVAYGDSTLARIQPDTLRRSGSALAGASPAGIAVGGGSIWVANSGDAAVQRFDPTTFEEGAIRPISVGRRPTAIAYGEGAVWVANLEDDTVTRIDPGTNSSFTIRVGDEPSAVAVGAGGVWVANSGDGTVSRIDPATNDVVRKIDVENAPAGIAVGYGFVWVTAQKP
ncbi:MAG: winged helix-turn-helix domain-containing protein [Actinobacteria bacterium]|nr:winged helix-turn-helix domain-containing protein [Actinomycetota bacterium]